MRNITIVLLTSLISFLATTCLAESKIRCGEIIEDEFRERGEHHDFILNLEPGTQVELSAVPVGETLKFHIKFIEPTGNVIQESNDISGRGIEDDPGDGAHRYLPNARIKTGVISSRGPHTVRIFNWNAGLYALYINCVLRDGTQIKAGPSQAPSN